MTNTIATPADTTAWRVTRVSPSSYIVSGRSVYLESSGTNPVAAFSALMPHLSIAAVETSEHPETIYIHTH